MNIERIRQLMMASLDKEISEAESRELGEALAANPGLRVQMRRLEELQRRLAGVRLKDPADDVLARLDATLIKRAGMPLGWLLFLAGAVLLLGWLAWTWIQDPSVPAITRWAAVALFAGLASLFIIKLRERLIERRSDPYRDVIR